MDLLATKLPGAYLIAPERHCDARGFVARTWCAAELSAKGLNTQIAQCCVAYNPRRGTLRGMHYQVAPCEEVKLVRCTRGQVYDVLVDLRPQSPTYRQWTAAILSADNGLMFYVPQGVAHGYETLDDETELFYQISAPYAPRLARGVRWDDRAFNIDWPLRDNLILSERDASYPDFVW
jgi:dTDP-4-dehydrorhamnose 3,5-epimerase